MTVELFVSIPCKVVMATFFCPLSIPLCLQKGPHLVLVHGGMTHNFIPEVYHFTSNSPAWVGLVQFYIDLNHRRW